MMKCITAEQMPCICCTECRWRLELFLKAGNRPMRLWSRKDEPTLDPEAFYDELAQLTASRCKVSHREAPFAAPHQTGGAIHITPHPVRHRHWPSRTPVLLLWH